MQAQKTAKRIQIAEWMGQVRECTESGMTIKQWCAEHRIATKTYYYRRKRVREELLDDLETANPRQLMELVNKATAINQESKQTEEPVFAALPIPTRHKGAAVTVWIGGCSVDIQNEADGAVVEQVLKVVSRL